MPHIIIEKSTDISKTESVNLLPKIQEKMTEIQGGNFLLESCKGRVFEFDQYFVGSKNQNNSSFFHITIKILEGRDQEIKIDLAQKINELAKQFLEKQKINKERIDLSVDIVDMDKDCYQKTTIA